MSRKSKNHKSNKIIIIFLAIILTLVLGYFGYKIYMQQMYQKNSVIVILKDDLTAEINDKYVLKSFIKEIKNGQIINGDMEINTSKLGYLDVEIIIKNKFDEEEKKQFRISVVDTIKPEIEAKENVTSYIGKNINLLDGVIVKDNSKEEIKAKVIGDYDINKVGEYKLKYEATDSSGNKNEYDFILNIVSDPNNRTFTTNNGFSGKVVNGITYIDGILIANKTYSLPSSYAPGLQSSITNAFNSMKNDASKLGYAFYIGSGYRSYWDQKIIYNNYVSWDGQANADTYSARPGHSEHQSGLAIDVCDSNVGACISSGFDSTEQAKWINDNCYKYGLIIRYPKGKDNITGYMYESWHLRYVGVELATKLYQDGEWTTLEEYYGIDSKYSYWKEVSLCG